MPVARKVSTERKAERAVGRQLLKSVRRRLDGAATCMVYEYQNGLGTNSEDFP